MPLMYFDVNTFKGRPVDTSEPARRHATLTYETENLSKMEALSPSELRASFGLLVKPE